MNEQKKNQPEKISDEDDTRIHMITMEKEYIRLNKVEHNSLVTFKNSKSSGTIEEDCVV